MPTPITAATTEFATLAEVKKHANISPTKTSDDDELSLFRDAAQEAVEHLIGPVLHRTVTETVSVSNGRALLSETPVLSVQSVAVDGAAVTYTVGAAGIVRGLPTYASTVAVTYTVGRDVLPASVVVATLIIAEHLWKTQRGQAPTPLQTEDGTFVTGLGYAIPNRAVDLLRPYLLAPAVG